MATLAEIKAALEAHDRAVEYLQQSTHKTGADIDGAKDILMKVSQRMPEALRALLPVVEAAVAVADGVTVDGVIVRPPETEEIEALVNALAALQ